jgi:hypothetical protein
MPARMLLKFSSSTTSIPAERCRKPNVAVAAATTRRPTRYQ